MQQGRVALGVADVASILPAIRAGRGCRVRRVVDMDQELDLLDLVRVVVRIESFHGHAAEHICDRGHCVCQTAQSSRRLDFIVN